MANKYSYEEGKQTVVLLMDKIAESEKAILCYDPNSRKKHWLPKSQFKYKPIALPDSIDTLALFLPLWLADKNKLNWNEFEIEDWNGIEEMTKGIPLDTPAPSFKQEDIKQGDIDFDDDIPF